MKVFEKINFKRISVGYLFFFCILMLVYCTVNVPKPIGEWDDYSLPIASILNDHNFSINDSDVAVYKKLFPNWATYIDNYFLSGYMTKNGAGQMPWYFPTYSIACIPFTLLLGLMELPTIYTFAFTNLAILMLSLIILFKCLKCDDKLKLLLLILLSINPICFYIGWTSAEVFIYSMLLMGLVFWYNRNYKRAAFFVSVAGMLNPTIMSIGIIMILEYFFNLISKKDKEKNWWRFIKENILHVIKYGCCYIVGIIPMIYNYYNVGHINLTASLSGFTQGNETTFSRFMAYLIDLNYGILPYYPFILIVSCLFLIVAVLKKHIRYIQWIIAFLLNMLLYSIMVHINSGMSGISRYNVWGVLPLIFAVMLFGQELIGKKIKRIFWGAISIGAIGTASIVFAYNPYIAKNTDYLSFDPIAKWVLDSCPSLYNPLRSTFNCRAMHIASIGDAGIVMPVTYAAEDGYVRKILATSADKEQLLQNYLSYSGDNEWFANQVNLLEEDASYISVPKKYMLVKVSEYTLGNPIIFTTEGYNAAEYIIQGMNLPEDWGSWTEGNKTTLMMQIESSAERLHASISGVVFNQSQTVIVNVNGKQVYNDTFVGGDINFDFENEKMVIIEIELPDATSPQLIGYSDDSRIIALGLQNISIIE